MKRQASKLGMLLNPQLHLVFTEPRRVTVMEDEEELLSASELIAWRRNIMVDVMRDRPGQWLTAVELLSYCPKIDLEARRVPAELKDIPGVESRIVPRAAGGSIREFAWFGVAEPV